MDEATRITVQLTADAVKRLNTNIRQQKDRLRDHDERTLATCLAACKARGLDPLLIRDIDGTVAVNFEKLQF